MFYFVSLIIVFYVNILPNFILVMRLFKVFFVVLLSFPLFHISAQDLLYEKRDYLAEPLGTITVGEITEDWNFRLSHFRELVEGNRFYPQHLRQLKKESALRFPRKSKSKSQKSFAPGDPNVPPLRILRNFEGNKFSNAAPNDNTLAISNSNQLISAINTNVYFYDMNKDSLLKTMSLNSFSEPLTGISQHQYDPKLLYDPVEDRFVLVFLAGASSDTKTDIVVGFSATSDMMGEWNIYSLPGNPLNDTSWSDFPSIALSEDELFITVNLLDYGTSWQTSFKQTIIWQVNKFDGYHGRNLNSRVWKDIIFDDHNIRNLNPIQGGDHIYGPNMYLLSNRNFTIYSDSIFLLEITGTLKDENTHLKITHLTTDVGYGAPPDARQPFINRILATNDARVLGGFLQNNKIQFVANTIDTTTGDAAIYHGFISNVSQNPEVKGRILSETGLEYGYPNIAFTGSTMFSQQSVIGFNHTGDTVYPGVSAIFYDGAGGYSKRAEIKTGIDHIRVFPGFYQRWGDYTGIQRKYNEPGKVWVSGMFGIRVSNFVHRLGTQIAELATGIVEEPVVTEGRKLDAALYPNPAIDFFGMEFFLDEPKTIVVELRSVTGQLLHKFFEGDVPAGKNALSFSTGQLAQGVHLIFILDKNGDVLFSDRIVKLAD